MSDIRLSEEDDDLLLVDGDLVLTTGADATRQRVQQSLRAFKGEWFLNLDDGVPYYQDVLVKAPNANVVDAVLRNAILSTPGVIELTEYVLDFDRAARELTLDFAVKSIEGDILNFSETIGV